MILHCASLIGLQLTSVSICYKNGISYLINSFSSDKNELVPFSLHSEAADRDRPRPLEAAGRARNRLFSLVEEAEWLVTGDADLKIPK